MELADWFKGFGIGIAKLAAEQCISKERCPYLP